jgi:tetratricopeptide (TPR) repeat protein
MRGVLQALITCACVLAAAGAMHGPTRAAAQASAGAGGSRAQGEYARLIRDALAEVDAGNWAEARALFERAHAISPNARTLRGLGVVAFEQRHYVQSITELQAALSDPRNPLTPEQRRDAQQAIARARHYVGSVAIKATPEDASIWLDGARLTQRELLLDVGDYVFTARAAGYLDEQRKVTIKGGQKHALVFDLTPRDLSVGAAQGSALGGAADARTAVTDTDSDSGGILSTWWFWTGLVAIAGGAAVGIVLLTQDDAPEGERGINGTVQVLSVGR